MFSLLELSAILLTLSALFGWLNRKFLPLPHTIGLLVMSVAVSLVMVTLNAAFPDHHLFGAVSSALAQVDFTAVVMNGMLGFLLFAGALQVDLERLRSRAIPVLMLATLGTIISTVVVGYGFYFISGLIGHPMTLSWALVFGAVISPTDPVAVSSTLKNVKVPPDLEIEMQGESLFNDGVGVVLFTVLLHFATGNENVGAEHVTELLLIQAGGGIALGLATGYLAYSAMRLVDDYSVEVLITLALVTGTYAIGERLHTSGPLSVVAAGLLIGDRAPRYAMSEQTQNYVFSLWTLIDEILNSVLFLLIGLEVLVLRFEPSALLAAVVAIPVVLGARICAVTLPPLLLPASKLMSFYNIPFLSWAGIRGGISVALALSIAEVAARPAILAATYGVVLFSIIVQGLTLGMVARKTIRADRQ